MLLGYYLRRLSPLLLPVCLNILYTVCICLCVCARGLKCTCNLSVQVAGGDGGSGGNGGGSGVVDSVGGGDHLVTEIEALVRQKMVCLLLF